MPERPEGRAHAATQSPYRCLRWIKKPTDRPEAIRTFRRQTPPFVRFFARRLFTAHYMGVVSAVIDENGGIWRTRQEVAPSAFTH